MTTQLAELFIRKDYAQLRQELLKLDGLKAAAQATAIYEHLRGSQGHHFAFHAWLSKQA